MMLYPNLFDTYKFFMIFTNDIHLFAVTISTSSFFDGLLVTGLYTSTTVQTVPITPSASLGFGKSVNRALVSA